MLTKFKSGPLAKWLAKLFSSAQVGSVSIESCNYTRTLSGYFKDGRVEDAERIFEIIPVKNVVVWSIMVHGYAKTGLYRKSVDCFTQMRHFGLVPNSFTLVGVLVSVSGLRKLILGQCVHGFISKSGWEANLIVSTALIDAYAKCGNVDDSNKIFQNMNDLNMVSWNAMIAGFLYNERFEEGFMLFKRFLRCGFAPNDAMVLSLTRGCAAVESERLCDSIYGFIIKLGFVSKLVVNNAVLSMYLSLMNLEAALKLFDSMECRDIISLTTIIGLFVRLEHASDAVKLFCQLRNIRMDYDSVLLMNLILACGLLGALKMGRSVHALAVINGFGSQLNLTNSLITMYSRCGELDSSTTVFNHAPVKSVVSFTSMILGYVQNGRPRKGLDLFIRVRAKEDYNDDSAILLITLTAAGEVAHLDLCQQLHCYISKAGFQHHRSIQNTLISIYSKCGNVELARYVFEQMGGLRDRVTWNALINGYGINGSGETAVSLFYEMRESGEDPDDATYLCVLSACSHSGLVSDGLMVFNQMIEKNRITPSQVHYGCVADLLARAGYVSDTSKFLEGLGSQIWKASINGCLIHGNVELAEFAAKRLYKEGLIEPGQVVLLSNLYASVGRFQDAEALRLGMDSRGLNKDPGLSSLVGNPYDAG